jgi:hypothetical protein
MPGAPSGSIFRDERRILKPIGQILLSNATKPDMHLAADPSGGILLELQFH